jgi:dipeptidase D
MDDLLAGLEPRPLWRYFLELSRIPRASKAEAEAAAWVAEQGRALGCDVERDEAGNVLLRRRAAPGQEGRATVALQAHVDMVCEKNEATPHDFAKDPIAVVRDGAVLRARGTTLGADDGIGVAAALAALAAPGLKAPALEVLVTVDEETGLTGANAVRAGWLRAKYLLNLDSEEEGELTIGCAGGMDTLASRRVRREPAPGGHRALRVKVHGLKGGHSGVDIGAGRANALRLLGEVLSALAPVVPLRLATVRGGNKRNAIAREAAAVVLVAAGAEAALREEVARLEAAWRAAFGAFDPGLALAVEPAEAGEVLAEADGRAVVGLLVAGPHGVEAMSPDIPGLVQTSTNMGLVETKGDAVEVSFLTRSAIDASKRALAGRVAAVAALAGFEARHGGSYPGWKPAPHASLVKLVDGVHAEAFGKPMLVKAIHAGLECGLIGEKYPEVEMVSFGPTIKDAHTPDEHVSIPSVQGFWKLLTAVLERTP